MATQPTCARFDLDNLPDVCRWIRSNLDETQALAVLEILTPLFPDEPHNDADWLDDLEDALMNGVLDPWIVEAVREQVGRGLSEYRWHQLKGALSGPDHDAAPVMSDQEAFQRIRRLARQVGGRAGSDGDDLIDEAPSILLLAVARFDGTSRFDPWARAVLRHHLVDRQRRRARFRPGSVDPGQDDPAPAVEVWETVLAEARQLRLLLDGAVFFPTHAEDVDHYAVIGLDLRLRLVERLAEVVWVDKDGVSSVPSLVERILPWRQWELPRRIAPVWPTLALLWERIRLAGPMPTQLDRVEMVRRALRLLAPELATRLPTETWNTWVNRGKKHLRQAVPAEAWGHLLSHLYPDRQRSPTEPTP